MSTGTQSQTPSATAEPGPVAFVSDNYRYSVTLPKAWRGRASLQTWDGSGAPEHAAPEVDGWVGPRAALGWAYAAPTSSALADYAVERAAADAALHPCPTVPEREQAISIDGVAAVLEVKHCPAEDGILVMAAYTVQAGIGYVFMYQNPVSHRGNANQASDQQDFMRMLRTIALPG